MRYANGDIYEGEFFNNKPHGMGKHTYADGEVYEGKFEKGEFVDEDGEFEDDDE
jgi:hypothetical protein